MFEVEEGKVILQGEVLFDSGSDELRPAGRDFLGKLAPQLAGLLAAEPDQMVLVGGHTDDKLVRNNARFASNWELSTARATAVTRVLMTGGVPAGHIVAAGFGAEHPRKPNSDDAARRQNRRIEVLLVPIHAVASR
jgi:flagellar motor protein MotB